MLREALKRGRLRTFAVYKEKNMVSHKLTYLFWECTLNCNFYCKHCGSSAGDKVYKNELATEEIKKTFREIAEDYDSKKIMLAITGGEPLLRKDLFNVMGYAHNLGFEWGMVTNGSLVTKEIAEKMKETGMYSVVVSIDGIGETHDDLRQKRGAYKKAIAAVKILSNVDSIKALQITTTLNRKNFYELEQMYETFVPLGITSWRVMNIDPIGRAEQNKELLLTDGQLKELLFFIKKKRKESKIDITYDCSGFLGLDLENEVRNHFFICNTGINTGSILHNGDIFVCPNVPRRKELIQGNVRKDRFSQVWDNKFEIFRDKNRTKCEKCAKCEWWSECLGSSYHLWDFEKKQPKFCHLDAIEK